MRKILFIYFVSLFVIAVVIPAYSYAGDDAENKDFGLMVEQLLNDQSNIFFGIERTLTDSAPASTLPFRNESQNAKNQVLLAEGLEVEFLTRNAGDKTDMFAFFPSDNPTHLISSVEGGRELIVAPAKFNPSVQRINLQTGNIDTILRGMDKCDGIRLTPWGTILATEETADGGAYEILNPLNVTEETVTDRDLGIITDPLHIVKRNALPTIAWEGIAILPSGVIIAGDELTPGILESDSDGGTIFKFIPDIPRIDESNITVIEDSPLVSGSVYALQISCKGSEQQFGQGCEIGNGSWIPVSAQTARTDAADLGGTGYYRVENLERDPMFEATSENPNAVRVCWASPGQENAGNFAAVFCAIDYEPLLGDPDMRTVVTNRFVEGDEDFNSFDNLAFQPFTNNLYVVEDHKNGDIFACLPDGEDRDIKTDGCVRILSVIDSSAEPTGFIFTTNGSTAYLSIQHSDDTLMPLFDDYPTDDIIIITGFKLEPDNDEDDNNENDGRDISQNNDKDLEKDEVDDNSENDGRDINQDKEKDKELDDPDTDINGR